MHAALDHLAHHADERPSVAIRSEGKLAVVATMASADVVLQRADPFARPRIETETAMVSNVPDDRLVRHRQVELDVHAVVPSPGPVLGRIDRLGAPAHLRLALGRELEQVSIDAVRLEDSRFKAGLVWQNVAHFHLQPGRRTLGSERPFG